MKKIRLVFLTGLAVVLPISVTIFILIWMGGEAERLLGSIIQLIFPAPIYKPGMGLAAGIFLIFLVGLLTRTWIVRNIIEWGESLISRIPLVKSIYGAVQDMLHFLSGSDGRKFDQVVSVTLKGADASLLGFVTRDQLKDLPSGLKRDDGIAVYLPMSYQIGGYTLFLPRSAVRPVEMPMQEAARFILTAGVKRSNRG